jgi:hypothetical protein
MRVLASLKTSKDCPRESFVCARAERQMDGKVMRGIRQIKDNDGQEGKRRGGCSFARGMSSRFSSLSRV